MLSQEEMFSLLSQIITTPLPEILPIIPLTKETDFVTITICLIASMSEAITSTLL